MTTLDRAFIKAFTRREAPPTTAPTDSPRAVVVSESPVAPEPVAPAAPAATAAEPEVTVESFFTAVAKPVRPLPNTPRHRLQNLPLPSRERAKVRGKIPGRSETSSSADPQTPLRASIPMHPQNEKGSELFLAAGAMQVSLATQQTNSSDPFSPPAQSWRPALQVDHFAFSPDCDRLCTIAIRYMDPLNEALVANLRAGRKIVGFTGSALGAGTTTLVQVAARSLAQRGLRVVLVDADPARAQLARQLGLAVQVGWEDVLHQALPLEEVVIESIADGLSILPMCAAERSEMTGYPDEARMAADLETLAAHYDAVLIDLGILEAADEQAGRRSSALGLAARLDGVVLVYDSRTTVSDRLAEVQRRLAAAGVVQTGVIQNFSPNA
ncbi:MAG: cellulose synthase operon protein YhjQ/BcsQ [Thermoguttaceae bacterium]|jgi:Mrp family chromosome partitioning ATPase